MITHLIFSTAGALLLLALALPRKRSAAMRHATLLLAIFLFAAYQPWLTRWGANLARLTPHPAFTFPLSSMFDAPAAAAPFASGPSTLPARVPVEPILQILWIAGALLRLTSWSRRYLRPVPMVREPSEHELSLLRRLNPHAGLRIVDAHQAPAVRGLWRPTLMLPAGLSSTLEEAELSAILAHELAHAERLDNLTASLAHAVVAVFWFHPLLWWMERRMLAERETACDELALAHGARPEDLVSALAHVAHMTFVDSSAYAGITGANLKQRMEQIMTLKPAQHTSKLALALPAGVLAAAMLLPFVGGYLRAQEKTTAHTAVDALANAGYGFWKAGDFARAEETFRRLRELAPNDPRGASGMAEVYWSENRSADAIALLLTESQTHPDNKEDRIALANLYVRAEQYDSALAIYQALLQNDSKNAMLLFRIGETYRRMGDLTAALDAFRRAMFADPQDPSPALQAALLLDASGKREEAAALYQQLLQLDPSNAVALNNLAFALADSARDLPRALEMARTAYEKLPDSADAADTLGWIYIKMNQGQQAAALYEGVLEKNPYNADFHYHFGMALLQTGDRAGAVRELNLALHNRPSSDVDKHARELLGSAAQ